MKGDDYYEWVCAELDARATQAMVDDWNQAMIDRLNPWTGEPLGEWFDYFHGDQ